MKDTSEYEFEPMEKDRLILRSAESATEKLNNVAGAMSVLLTAMETTEDWGACMESVNLMLRTVKMTLADLETIEFYSKE